MEEFKDAPDEATGNKKKKVVGVAAGFLALFAGCKLLKICKKRKQEKGEEEQNDL